MKILGVYGSQNKKGCTYTALQILGEELAKENIGMDLIHIGTEAYKTCCDCRYCRKHGHRCAYNDIANEILDALPSHDGLVLASSTHFMNITGGMKTVMDRVGYASEQFEDWNKKPCAVIAVSRRTGANNSCQQLIDYLDCGNQIIVGTQYWPILYGWKPEEMLAQDKEGVETIRVLGKNLAWMLKVVEFSKDKIEVHATTKRTRTNFCR